MKDLKETLKQAALQTGAQLFGVTDSGRLKETSCTDTDNLLTGTKSVVVFGVALNRDIIKEYLQKTSFAARDNMSRHEGECYHLLWKIGNKLTDILQQAGYQAVNAWPNKDYRDFRTGAAKQSPFALTPDFAHRYAAVAAGLGGLGWSSNVVTKEYGAAIYFSSVLTTAVLEPDPLPEENPCDNCGLCTKVCQVGFVHKSKETKEIKLGEQVFSHKKSGFIGKCVLCCGGWVNQHQYPDWTTFSPLNAKFSYPEIQEEFINEYKKMSPI
jgi:epoxyqueuosine reductase QueG